MEKDSDRIRQALNEIGWLNRFYTEMTDGDAVSILEGLPDYAKEQAEAAEETAWDRGRESGYDDGLEAGDCYRAEEEREELEKAEDKGYNRAKKELADTVDKRVAEAEAQFGKKLDGLLSRYISERCNGIGIGSSQFIPQGELEGFDVWRKSL